MSEIIGIKEDVVTVKVNGYAVDNYIHNGHIFASCDLNLLKGISASAIPEKITFRVKDSTEFVYPFDELQISRMSKNTAIDFICDNSEDYWNDHYTLSIILGALIEQAKFVNDIIVEVESRGGWNLMTLRKIIDNSSDIFQAITETSLQAKTLIRDAEISLSGLEWKAIYDRDEASFVSRFYRHCCGAWVLCR